VIEAAPPPSFSSRGADLPNGEVLVVVAHLITYVLVQHEPLNDATAGRVRIRFTQHLLQVRGLRLHIQLVADVDLGEPDGHLECGEFVQDAMHHQRWSMDPLVPQIRRLEEGPRQEVVAHDGGRTTIV
jgi:hypothetical protein